MNLFLEHLENRVLLAVPIAPYDLDLLAGRDSGDSDSDNITRLNDGTLEFVAEKDATVSVYNAGYIGDAVGQGDTLFAGAGTEAIIEAEKGTVAGATGVDNATGGFEGTGYIEDTAATPGNPELGGTATYSFYVGTEADYYVHGRCYFPDGSQNSWFVNIDDTWEVGDGNNWPSLWSTTYSSWHMTTATDQPNDGGVQSWHLTVGWHTLEIHGREQGSLLDRIVIDTNTGNPGDPGGTETVLYETYQYTFNPGDLIGSAYGSDNSITATATNLDGAGPASAPLTITYDNNTFTPATPDLAAASDTGDSNTDDLTNETLATFTGGAGSVEANASLELLVDDAVKVTGTANADGSWSLTLDDADDMAEGDNDITIRYTDSAGNVSAQSAALTVTLDTTANVPALAPDLDPGSDTGLDNADDYTNDTTPTFTGAAGSVEGDSTVWLRVGGINKQSTTANADGSYSVTLEPDDMAEGNNTIDVIYIDQAGNTSSDSLDLTVDLDTLSARPAAPDLTSNATHDTGSSQIDNITSNEACEITGTAESDATVHVYVNGVEVGTANSDGAGNWTYTFDGIDDLIEGPNTVMASIEDSLGNPEGALSNSLIVTLDRIMATPAMPDLQAASDSGASNTDNVTAGNGANNLVFEGYAEPGSTVQLNIDGAPDGGTTVANAATGYWTITRPNTSFNNGNNNVTITAADTAGNQATSPALVVYYDGAGNVPNAPLLHTDDDSGISNNDQITNIATAMVYGSVGDGNEVEGGATVHVRTNKNGGGWGEVGTTVADSSGNWSYTFDGVDDLAEGTNLVEIYITDLSSNDSAMSADLTITLDNTVNQPVNAPDLSPASDTGSLNTDNITNETSPVFTGPNGSVEADSTVWLRIDGVNAKSAVADGNGAWSITLDGGELTEGTHIIDIINIDLAGNTSIASAAISVTLDTAVPAPAAAPNLEAATDTGVNDADDLTRELRPTFSGPAGSVEPNAAVNILVGGVPEAAGTADAYGAYTITMDDDDDLAEGLNNITITYTDVAGNVSAASPALPVTQDTLVAVPAVPDLAESSDTGSDSTDDITAETRPTIQGGPGSVEGSSIVTIWLDTPGAPDTAVGTTSAAANGSWSYTFTSANPLEEGANQIHIVAQDPAGNTSSASLDLTVTINFDIGAEGAPDLVAASDSGALNTDNITNDSTPTIAGICPDNAIIKIRYNESNIISFTDNDAVDTNPALGQWVYTFDAGDLVEGFNNIDFLTIDTDNNNSDWSLDLVIQLDTNIDQPTQPNLITADDSGSNSGDKLTNVTLPTLTGAAEAGSTVTIDINAGDHTDTTTAGADGSWSYTIPNNTWLNEGANNIFVTALDTAGNTSADSAILTINLDTTINAPSIPDLAAATDTGVNDDNITSHANPRIFGTADPNTTISVRLDPNGAAAIVGSTTADGAGNWTYTFSSGVLVNEADNEIDVVSTDSAGNAIDSGELTIRMETIISIPDNLDLTAASDTGAIDNDNITSFTTATITGTSDIDSTIHVRVNGTIVGTTTDDADGFSDGFWQYTFDGIDDLIEGVNLIDACAEDNVGNVSDFSADLSLTLDTATEIPVKPDLSTASDTGTINTDNYTNDTTPTISGYCEAGAVITINLNGADIDTVADDADGFADGKWSYTFAPLAAAADGQSYDLKVRQEDIAGNVSADYSGILTFIIDDAVSQPAGLDLLAAYDTGDADDDDITRMDSIIITGIVEAGSSVDIYVEAMLVDSISEKLVASGSFNYNFSSGQLAEGDNQITAVATDKAGNISAASDALTITLDTTIGSPSTPDLSADSDTGEFNNDNITSDVTPTFTGVCDPYAYITLRVDGDEINTVTADAAGNWSYTFAQGEIQTGVHRIDVIAADAAGNQSYPSDDLTIWLNIVPTQPAAPNLKNEDDSGSIATDNLTSKTDGRITGKADPDRTVEVYVDEILVGASTSDNNGFWEYTFNVTDLHEGENEITIITEDSSGLRSTSSYPLNITLDTTPPTATAPDLDAASDTGISDSDNLTSDKTATIQGETEPFALVDIYHEEGFINRLTASSTGGWSYTFSPTVLANGANNVSVQITDTAGNTSAMSDPLVITLDVASNAPDAPVIKDDSDSGSSSSDGRTNSPTPVISGTLKPDSQVEILVSGQSVATVQADDTGCWEYTFADGQLEEGTNFVEVLSTDPVGNVARSSALELDLDTTPPVVYNYYPRDVHTQTTQTIELYIQGDDLDIFAAENTQGYEIMGSGGDGSFNDGNEWTVPVNSITIDTVSGLIQLKAAVVLTDDTYQLVINSAETLRDDAGNPAQINISAHHLPARTYSPDMQSLVFTFVIDTAGPEEPTRPEIDAASDSGSSDSDNITRVKSPNVFVSADPDLTVEFICNGFSVGFADETSPGFYELEIDSLYIREGENLILARAFDALGNSSDLSGLQTIVYDSQNPGVAAIIVDELWYDHGPRQINFVFNEVNIDPVSVLDAANYQLLGSGGDGAFNDGNETIISFNDIHFNPQTQTITITLPLGSTGDSRLGPDTYQFQVRADSAISDLAGNRLSQSQTVEFAVIETITIRNNEKYVYNDPSGKTVVVTLKGQGEAHILPGAFIGDANVIERISLEDTNENTQLRIKANRPDIPLSIGHILSDAPLRIIQAPQATLTEQIDISAGLAGLYLGDILADSTISISTDTAKTPWLPDLTFSAGHIGQNVSFDIDLPVNRFTIASMAGGTMTVETMDTLLVSRGDFSADIVINQGDIERLSVNNGNIAGSMTAAGSLKWVFAPRGVMTADITAGHIGNVALRGLSGSVVRSHSSIDSIKLFEGDNVTVSAQTSLDQVFIKSNLENSLLSAGTDMGNVRIGGDALDNLFLSGRDLGDDGQRDENDIYADSKIEFIQIIGSFRGSTVAASINPGSDTNYFSEDDSADGIGRILKISLGRNALQQTDTANPFGFLAGDEISPLLINGQISRAPFQLDMFRMALMS